MNLRNKTVWITGASSGIGEAIALELASRENNLILSARREKELLRVKKACEERGGKAEVLCLDLLNLDDPAILCEKAIQKFGGLDVLINNGGISQRSKAFETPMENHQKIMQINYFSAVALSTEALKHFKRQGSGQLVGISSIVGFFGFKMRCAYSASKHALKGFLESVRLEEHKNGIEVSVVYPGTIRTNISESALEKDGARHGVEDERHTGGMSPEKCAKIIVRGMQRNKPEILVGKKELLMVYFKRYFPWLFYRIAVNIKAT